MPATTPYDLLIIGSASSGLAEMNALTSTQQALHIALVDAQPQLDPDSQRQVDQWHASGHTCELLCSTRITDLRRQPDGGYLAKTTDQQTFSARRVIVAAGSTTLLLAQRMGYGLNLSLLPLAGCQYTSDQGHQLQLRYFTPVLEQGGWQGFVDYLRILRLNQGDLRPLFSLLSVKPARKALLASLIYGFPPLTRWLLLRRLQRQHPDGGVTQVSKAENQPLLRSVIQLDDKSLAKGPIRIEAKDDLLFVLSSLSRGTLETTQTVPPSESELTGNSTPGDAEETPESPANPGEASTQEEASSDK